MKLLKTQYCRFVSVVMSILLMVLSVPVFELITIAIDSQEDIEYVIWDANPDRVASNVGDSVAPATSNFWQNGVNENVQTAVKDHVDGETAIRLTYTKKGPYANGNQVYAFVDSGIMYTTNTAFAEFLAKPAVFNALAPYMTYNADYKSSKNVRIRTELMRWDDIVACVGGVLSTGEQHSFGYTANVDSLSSEWLSVEKTIEPVKTIDKNDYEPWSYAYLGFRITAHDVVEDITPSDPVIVHIKNIRIVVKESQRAEINEALTAAGTTITFDDLIEFDKESAYSKNHYEKPVEKEYVIWDANPNRVAGNFGDSVAPISTNFWQSGVNENIQTVVKDEVDGETAIKITYTKKGAYSNGNLVYAFVDSGIRHTSDAIFGELLAKPAVFNALAPYMTYKADYKASKNVRIRTELMRWDDIVACVGGVLNTDTQNPFGYTANVDRLSKQWLSVEKTIEPVKTIDKRDYEPWSYAYLGFRITAHDVLEDITPSDPVIVHVKNIRIVIKEAQREEINEALAAVGATITFDDLASFDLKSEYGSELSEGYYKVSCEGDENATVSADFRAYKAGENVKLNISVTDGYSIKEINVISGDQKIDVVNGNFVMPASEVKVKVVSALRHIKPIDVIWYFDPVIKPPNPWYINTASQPYTLSKGGDEERSYYKFTVKNTEGSMTLYGTSNSYSVLSKYYDTAELIIEARLESQSGNNLVKIGSSSSSNMVEAQITNEFTEIHIPIKQISSKDGFGYLMFDMSNLAIGDVLYISKAVVWTETTGKGNAENYEKLFDMSGYEKAESNNMVLVIGDPEGNVNPWSNTDYNTSYMSWDIAWYELFQNMYTYIVSPKADATFGEEYELTFYPERYKDLSLIADTGYVEFFIKANVGDRFTFTLFNPDSSSSKQVSFPFEIKSEKLRQDGFMRVQIPLSYFADLGYDMTAFKYIALRGWQTISDSFFLSSFRIYDRHADVADPPNEIEEIPEPPVERDYPISINSSVLNAYLDEQNFAIYYPESTRIWELLAALELDTEEVTVSFVSGEGTVISDTESLIPEDATLTLYRRGYLIKKYPLLLDKEGAFIPNKLS